MNLILRYWIIKFQAMNSTMNKKTLGSLFLGIIFIILLWHISSVLINNSIVIPEVSSVISALGNLLSSINTYYILIQTIIRLLVIVSLSFLIALVLVTLSIYSKYIGFFLKPTISFIRATPIVSIIIVLLVIIGNNKTPAIVTSFILIPIFYESLLMGINSIDQNVLDDVKTISNFSFPVLFRIYIPLVFTEIITSLLQAFGLGLKSLVMSEFIAQPKNSIGYEILQSKNDLRMEYVFAWTIIIVFLVLVFEQILYRLFEERTDNI